MLGKLFSPRAAPGPGAAIRCLLARYTPYRVPHPGPTKRLSDDQCRENLAYLLVNKAERLEIFSQCLNQFGVDLSRAPQAKPDELGALFKAVDHWARAELPRAPDRLLSFDVFVASDRDGPDKIFSLITDLGIFEGEQIVTRRPDFTWALDVARDNRVMSSYRRPTVFRERIYFSGHPWSATSFDFEDLAFGFWRGLEIPGSAIHPFGETALATIAGGHDPPA